MCSEYAEVTFFIQDFLRTGGFRRIGRLDVIIVNFEHTTDKPQISTIHNSKAVIAN